MVTATYENEDLEITFRGGLERCDYGVPRSPTWNEVVDVEVEQVQIMGFDVDPKVLPKELINEMMKHTDDLEFS